MKLIWLFVVSISVGMKDYFQIGNASLKNRWYLGNGTTLRHIYNGGLIRNRMWHIKWNQNQRPWMTLKLTLAVWIPQLTPTPPRHSMSCGLSAIAEIFVNLHGQQFTLCDKSHTAAVSINHEVYLPCSTIQGNTVQSDIKSKL